MAVNKYIKECDMLTGVTRIQHLFGGLVVIGLLLPPFVSRV